MQQVYIGGVGAVPVGEHYTRSLTDLSLEALRGALNDAGPQVDPTHISALYVANAFGETLALQSHLGAALATAAGLPNIEAVRVEAAGASGGAALHQAMIAVASGLHEVVAVLGVEKVTDKLLGPQEASMALAAHSETEGEHGITLTAQWAMLMRRYMHEYGCEATVFAPFPVNAHSNGSKNSGALYRFRINPDKYAQAMQIASPLNMLDCSTLADGAAAVLVVSERYARELDRQPVRIAGSSIATSTLPLHARQNPLWLEAGERSTAAALKQADVTHQDINVLELTDPHGIAAALVLEAGGFVERGTAPTHAADGGITPEGPTPIATAGGYKSRGDVGGATGVYQAVEVVQQLRGEAATQVANARVGFVQCVGGVGGTAISHILIAQG
jgi:acetyl-CoA C-acetyltransferase